MTWQDKAACIGHEEPFVDAEEERGERRAQAIRAAKDLCRSCTVARICLDAALATEGQPDNSRWSIRGGMTPAERRREWERRAGVRRCLVCRRALPEDMQASAKYHRECKAEGRRMRQANRPPSEREQRLHADRERRRRERLRAKIGREVKAAKAKSEAARAVMNGGLSGRRVS